MPRWRRLAAALLVGAAVGVAVIRRQAVAERARDLATAARGRGLSRLLPLLSAVSPKPRDGRDETTLEFPDKDLIRACVHCGLCLPYCPTYQVLGVEMDSPRGRIYQMKLVAEGKIDRNDVHFRKHMLQCLDCRACETACPSGVQYGRLIEAARSLITSGNVTERITRRLLLGTALSSRPLLDAVGVASRLYQRSGLQTLVRGSRLLKAVPRLDRVESMLPTLQGSLVESPLPAFVAARGERRCRVAFLSGCIAARFFPDTNRATLAVLAANGCEVVTPPNQGCCGALQNHSGDRSTAMKLARHNIDVFDRTGADYVVTNAAGCGSMLKEYGALLRDDPDYAERARAFSARARDVTELLSFLGLRAPTHPVHLRVTYQDACHLRHAQKVKRAPRELLEAIPGLELVEMRESDTCCGSAGSYNVTQPALSEEILARKMDSVVATGADSVVASNPGCLIQLEHGLRDRGLVVRAVHPIDLLAEAYGFLPQAQQPLARTLPQWRPPERG